MVSVISLVNREIEGGVNIFRIVPFDEAAAEAWWNQHSEGRFQAVVAERFVAAPANRARPHGAELRSRFAGWAAFTPHSAYEGYDRTAELSVWVDPECRRCGCGRALIQTLLDSCPQRNFRSVISRIESNNVASLRLHEVCGFRRVGLLEDVGEKFGRSLSVVFMQYQVPPPADSGSDSQSSAR